MRGLERKTAMRTISFKSVVGALLVAANLGAVCARAEGLYAGGGLGAPRYQNDVNGISGNGSGLSGKLFGGYQFTPNYAIEGGVAYLGHIESASGTVNGRSEFLDMVGTLPLNDTWSLLGRLGIAHVALDTPIGNSSGNGLKLGFGGQYALTKSIFLRGEWERYRPEVFNDRSNIDQFSLGMRFTF
jgi:OmpA-OmpF porin, OOP family